MTTSYQPRTKRNQLDWDYVRAALAIGHTMMQIRQAMPHNPGFAMYCKRNGWL